MKNSVPLSARIGFGVGDLSFNLVWQGTSLFLLYFYTDVLGISPTVAGVIYLVAMVWDAVTDPVIATIADRTQTSMGKYRPWLLFGAAPFAISYPLAFSSPPSFLAANLVAWALITHVLLRTTYTTVSMPFNSLQARLTDDAQERTVLAGFRMVGAAAGALSVAFVTPIIVSNFGAERELEAYFTAAVLIGIFAFLTLLYCFFAMREPKITEPVQASSFFDDLKSIPPLVKNNPPLARVLAVVIIASVCLGMFSGSMLYYFKYHLKAPDQAVVGLMALAVFLIIAVPLWVWVAGKTSKRFSFLAGLAISFTGYLLFFFNMGDDFNIALVAIAMCGFGMSAFAVMFWAMLPDTIEYGEAMNGVRAEARTFGLATFAQKAAVGINAVLFGILLDISGFNPNAEQSESTLLGMKAIMAIVPAIGAILVALILAGYRLDQKKHAELIARIEEANRDTSTVG